MKILVVDQTCQLPDDRVFYREVGRLAGETVTILTPDFWKREWGVVRLDPRDTPEISVVSAVPLFRPRQHRVIYPRLPRLIGSIKPDVLFVNAEPEDWVTWQSARAIARYSPQTRLVFMSWRNIEFVGDRIPYKLGWLHALAERRVLASQTHCVARCSEAPGIFSRLGFNDVMYIPPAIDTTLFAPPESARERPSLPLRILFVGRFHRLKGGEVLLNALKGLDGVRLTMIGGGPAEESWRRIAKELGVDAFTDWIPPKPHAQLPDSLRAHDLLVLPSLTGHTWKEQFGRVLAEAMACGLPVIGSTSGEIPRVVGDAGLIVKEGDIDALREAISTIRDHPEMGAAFGKQGRSRVTQEYSVEVTARQFHSYVTSLVR